MEKNKPQIITLPKICDPRGNLTFVEGERHMPFEIARVYWTYDVPSGEVRGSHSHHVAEELISASCGSFNVNLYVPPGYWRTLDNFSSGSVCMVLTSIPYSEDDYVRDYNEFMKLAAQGKQ